MATTVEFTRKRGDTYPIELTVVDTEGTPLNVTGATFLLTVDPSESPTDATTNLFQSTGTITSALNGQVEFPITAGNADQTGTYYFDIQMTDSDSIITTLVTGTITWEQDITK